MNLQKPPSESICDQIADLIPAYALGAADPDERTLVEANLSRCPGAQEALAEYSALSEHLLFSIPPATPPAGLAARIEAALDADPSSTQPHVTAAPHMSSRLAQITGWLFPRGWASSPLAALLLLIILIGGGVYAALQFNQLHTQQMALLELIDEQAALIAQQGEMLQDQTQVLVLLSEGNAVRAELPPAGATDPAVTAAVVYDPQGNQAFIYADGLPILDVDQTYQVWLIQGETRVSGGTFNVDHYGRAMHLLWNRQPIGTYDAIGITPEPAGGSPAPTASPVVRGQLTAANPLYGQNE